MAWTKDLLLGIEEIDQQHQMLFDCLARLEHAVTMDERWSAVHFGLVQLSDFVRIHFTVEETLLRLHGYPDLEAHIAEHRRFAIALGTFKEESIRGDVSGDMVEFLRNWLTNHIGKTDTAYVPHLRTAAIARS